MTIDNHFANASVFLEIAQATYKDGEYENSEKALTKALYHSKLLFVRIQRLLIIHSIVNSPNKN